ncbi:MAG: stage 0 sporulation family protein [Oscillospiraceae bacterium]
MLKVVGVRFKEIGKIYYFDPKNWDINLNDDVIVETSRGTECGKVVLADREIDETALEQPIKPVIRLATKEDYKIIKENKEKEKKAFEICQQKIVKHKLDMNLISAEYTFDNSKLLFYFTADGRVDFRELVKDLASVFRTRIELRQIGVRDEAKKLGGCGICGQPYCCSRFLGDFVPVSIKMAKEQSLSLNPSKISGSCGRLMCCLNYEQKGYEELLKVTPKAGAVVKTENGIGVVIDVNLITGMLRIKMNETDAVVTLNKKDVEVIKDTVIKVGKDELKELKNLE